MRLVHRESWNLKSTKIPESQNVRVALEPAPLDLRVDMLFSKLAALSSHVESIESMLKDKTDTNRQSLNV